MTSGTTSLEMRLVIGLNSIRFGALGTDPLPVTAVLPPKVLLDPNQVAESMARVMV